MNPITQGLFLMMIGMVVVFVFLTLIVIMVQLASAFFRKFARFFPEQTDKQQETPVSIDNTEIAVAIAAVRLHS